MWDAATSYGEDWLEQGQPPFWGRTTKRPPQEEGRPGLRRTEGESPFAAKSVFQIGGAGAVGTGSVRGMPLLAALSADGFSVRPFDDASERMVIEIYPRILTRGVVKSDHLARERTSGRTDASRLISRRIATPLFILGMTGPSQVS